MKGLFLMATCLALCCSEAPAQFVKGNEAINVAADGTKSVQTPPLPTIGLAPPCPAVRPGCAGGGWKMIETGAGLMECTEFYARPTTCRASTYGSEKLSRVWIVKAGGEWKQCQFPDLGKTCVSTKNLPIRAVQ